MAGGCMVGGCAWQERRPLQRTVRILLECILVLQLITPTTLTYPPTLCYSFRWIVTTWICFPWNGSTVFQPLPELLCNAKSLEFFRNAQEWQCIRGFISWKQKISVTKCYPSDYWTIASPTCSSLHNLAFACKTDTLSSLYSHALLILTKSSKSKHQVVHEQKFKDLLSSTC